jgi:hypothetical protein
VLAVVDYGGREGERGGWRERMEGEGEGSCLMLEGDGCFRGWEIEVGDVRNEE